MTPTSVRARGLMLVGLTAVVTATLGFLYVQTQKYDSSSYFENVALLRQLKQLDARWELDVLKSRMGINADYDSLVDPLFDLNHLQKSLQDVIADQKHMGDGLAKETMAFHEAVEVKTRLIEDFKSHNSVLRNSLAFLPTASDDVELALRLGKHDDARLPRRISPAVNYVLLKSMVYSQAPADESAAEIEERLKQLESLEAGLSSGAREALVIFAMHVRTLLREQPAVTRLLLGISGVPAAARIDDLDKLLSGEKQQADFLAQRYRQYSLVFAAALAALLLYLAVNLFRSHTVINRVNRELQATNATLEERVEERTRELQAAQGELIATARRAGMAEIANNVLHNVGNVLNSVNVSAELISVGVRRSKADGLVKAVALLDEHAGRLGEFFTCDEKGKRLPGYLNRLVKALDAEQRNIIQELDSLTRSVQHIKDIVATQQSYAGSASMVEVVDVGDLLKDALRMNAGLLARNEVTVHECLMQVPRMALDRARVLQILVNLIGNAAQSLHEVGDRPRELAIHAALEGDAERALQISVRDNGVGISPDVLPQLFVHGFTTRRAGHGFGLHSCAIAAKEMGGTLMACSDGNDQGAVFTLQLPIKLEAESA
jgi:two-component system NtrC family sensor kinase